MTALIPKGVKPPRNPKPDAKVRDRKYLDYLRSERCILTGMVANECEAVDPAHVGTYAKGAKTDDEALPFIHHLHLKGHQIGEITMLREHAPDWLIRDALRAYARERYREWKQYGEWRGGKFG